MCPVGADTFACGWGPPRRAKESQRLSAAAWRGAGGCGLGAESAGEEEGAKINKETLPHLLHAAQVHAVEGCPELSRLEAHQQRAQLLLGGGAAAREELCAMKAGPTGRVGSRQREMPAGTAQAG